MNPSPTTRLRLVDRLSREWYVLKVDFLAQDVPSGYRKERRRELRSDLGAAAADVGNVASCPRPRPGLGPGTPAQAGRRPPAPARVDRDYHVHHHLVRLGRDDDGHHVRPDRGRHPAGRRPDRDGPRLLARDGRLHHERSTSPIRSVGGLGPHARRPYRGTPACGPHLAIPPSLAAAATGKQSRHGT